MRAAFRKLLRLLPTRQRTNRRTVNTRPTLEILEDRNLLANTVGDLWLPQVATASSTAAVLQDDHDHDHAHSYWQIPAGLTTGAEQAANFVTGSKWPQSGGLGSAVTLTYSFSNLLDGNIRNLTTTQIRSAIEEALSVWAEYAPLRFVEVADSGPLPTQSEASYSASGRPQLRFGHHYLDGDSGANTLAHAYYPGQAGLAGDLHFDNSNSWTIGLFLETAVHEIGHTLGLDHEETSDAIMNPTLRNRYAGLGEAYLLQDDINGIRAQYGTGIGFVTPLAGAIGAFTLIGPAGATSDTTPTFSWTQAVNATRYELWVDNPTTGERVIYEDDLTGTTFTPTAELAAGSYRFYVRARSATVYGEWSSASVFAITAPIPGTPTLQGPTGATTDATPTFTWNAVADATRYELWVDNAAGQRVLYQASLTDPAYTTTTPLAAGSYRFWVRAYLGATPGSWSLASNFNITVLQPGSATVTAPTGSTTDTTPTITWTTAANATRYELWVDSLATGQRVLYDDSVAATTFTPAGELAAGSYRAWVRPFNGATPGTWSAAHDFTITALHAGTVTLLTPTGSITNPMPTFTWTTAANATRYELWVDNRTTGQRALYDATITGTSYTPVAGLTTGNYRFWVRPFNGATPGDWSAGMDFNLTVARPGTVTVQSPDTITFDRTPTFSWTTATNATSYELWVSNVNTNQRVLYRMGLTGTSFTPTSNLGGGSYRVWVRAFNGSTAGDWSAGLDFTLLAGL